MVFPTHQIKAGQASNTPGETHSPKPVETASYRFSDSLTGRLYGDYERVYINVFMRLAPDPATRKKTQDVELSQFDPERSAYGLAIGSALILAEDAGRLAIVTCPGRKR
jgi:hypothetical protein